MNNRGFEMYNKQEYLEISKHDDLTGIISLGKGFCIPNLEIRTTHFEDGNFLSISYQGILRTNNLEFEKPIGIRSAEKNNFFS